MNRRAALFVGLAALCVSASCAEEADPATELVAPPRAAEVAVEEIAAEAGPPSNANSFEEAALIGSRDVVDVYVDALVEGRFEQAQEMALGEAAALARYLSDNVACGFGIASAEVTAPTRATLFGPGRVLLDGEVDLRLLDGSSERMTGFVVAQERDGSWRLHDVRFGSLNVADVAPILEQARQREVQFIPTHACIGEHAVSVSYELFNDQDIAFRPISLEFITPDGRRFPLTTPLSVAAPVVPERTARQWELQFLGADGRTGGEILLLALDDSNELRDWRLQIPLSPLMQGIAPTPTGDPVVIEAPNPESLQAPEPALTPPPAPTG